ncbi:uncharacterized protein [Nerophis lumbriciformis]|uniref:uncharacterized protein n=1 Tax=Nerophis lumbriciformis TaxID=546530 RepID=UPI002AE06B6A|nr:uncharacterized protein LOC133581548 [Nerophis lumbriciformis]XP_061791565.1 uncharacterized protein LOC133581548 [Nerophis lumbriciformis]
MQAIVDLAFPPVPEGGSLWLNTLDKLTAGYTLSVADFRGILYRCVSTQDGQNMEQQAGLLAESSTSPVTPYIRGIATAMRSLFPLPCQNTTPTYRWKDGESPYVFIDQAKEQWSRATGVHPSKEGEHRQFFRRAVLDAMPTVVRRRMDDNPDIHGAKNNTWQGHLIHHMQNWTEQDAGRVTRKQLLKLQIAEDENLKEPKGQRSASVYSAVGDLAFESQQVEDTRRVTRRLDSGGGHGALRPRQGENCFICDQPGHWQRECPNSSERDRLPIAAKTSYRHGKGRPRQKPQQEIQTGPLLDISVNGQCYQFVIDTGATHSFLNAEVPKKLCASFLKVEGFAEVTRMLPVTKPLPVQIAGHTLKHPFMVDLHTPCLIGNDLLYRLYPDIQYRTEGTFLVLPDGSTTKLRHHYQSSSMSSYHSLKHQKWLTSPAALSVKTLAD